MKICSKVEVAAIVQYLYMHVHMYPGNTQILIYLDGEHCTLTIENVLSASHSCRFQMAASIKTNKIDFREFVLYSTGFLKAKKYQPSVNIIQKCCWILSWIIPFIVSRMMYSREGYFNVSPCTSLLGPDFWVVALDTTWLPYNYNNLVSHETCSTNPCCKSLFLWPLTNLLHISITA